jgi:predicted lipoprotein with Yx(FWY)xxD motif
MKMFRIVGVIAVAAFALVGAAVAGAKPAAHPATVATAPTGLGRILVDGRGRSLYLFEKDARGRSACSGACAIYWPPVVTSGKAVAGKGVKASLLGSIRRSDGSRQVTYAGHPLYYFSGDGARGQTNGQGLTDFGAAWYVVAGSGQKIDRG